MSTNREAGIGVCGVVVGIILGAGAILYTSDYSVSADLAGTLIRGMTVAYRGADIDFDRDYFKKRAVSDRDSSTRTPSQVVTEPRLPRTPLRVNEQDTRSVQPDAKCLAKLRVIAQVREAVQRLVPSTSDYTKLTQRITAALNDATQECVQEIRTQQSPVQDLEQQKPSSVSKTARPTLRVNNRCSQYGVGTQRYTRCLVNEREGQRYVGRQTKQYDK